MMMATGPRPFSDVAAQVLATTGTGTQAPNAGGSAATQAVAAASVAADMSHSTSLAMGHLAAADMSHPDMSSQLYQMWA